MKKLTFPEYCEQVEEVSFEYIVNNYGENAYNELWSEYIDYYMSKEYEIY